MKFRLQHESEIHAAPNILLKSFRRKKGEKSSGTSLMKTMAPVQTAWYVETDISANLEDTAAKEDVSNSETASLPVAPPTTNVMLKSFRKKKTDVVNNNYLKPSSAVKTSWYVDAHVGAGGGDDGGEVGVCGGGGGGGGGGEGGERWVPCVLLGDGMVGKSSLTVRYTRHVFNDRYTATVFDNCPVPVQINGEKYVVDLCDTAGQSDYESLRTSSYESSEVLVLCFSVCDRESFHNVLHSWVPEIQRHAKGRRPLLLVGTQIDLRASYSSSSDLKSSPSSDLKSSSSDLRASSSSSSDLKSSSSSDLSSSSPSDLKSSSSSSDLRASNSSPSDHTNANSSPKDLEASRSSPSSHRTSNSSSSVPKSSPSDSKASNSSSSPNIKASSKSSSQAVKTSDSSSSERRISHSSSSTSACQDEVSTEEGRQLAKIIGADCYIECSARSEEGVQQVFEQVVFSALRYRKKKNRLLFRLFSR